MQPTCFADDVAKCSRYSKFTKLLNEVQFLPIQVYTSTVLVGSTNQSYELCISHNGKFYNGRTYLLQPPQLDTLFWKRETATTEDGYSWARLSDPNTSADSYRWEVRRSGIFSDEFFNGLEIEFYFQNPLKRKDSTHLKEYRRYYRYGDSVVVKFSKMDKAVFLYYDRMSAQLDAASNPYATPVNIPSNIKGCLGIWAGFSPWHDTLICVD